MVSLFWCYVGKHKWSEWYYLIQSGDIHLWFRSCNCCRKVALRAMTTPGSGAVARSQKDCGQRIYEEILAREQA